MERLVLVEQLVLASQLLLQSGNYLLVCYCELCEGNVLYVVIYY